MERSSFNGLPAEIRIEIYRYALLDESTDHFPKLITEPEPALTLSCNEIRKEYD